MMRPPFHVSDVPGSMKLWQELFVRCGSEVSLDGTSGLPSSVSDAMACSTLAPGRGVCSLGALIRAHWCMVP